MSDKKDIDQVSGVETTGHEWDGIKELNNPLPRWWLWSFYACIIFSIGYMVWYPAIPLWEDGTRGLSGHTNRKGLQERLVEVEASKAGINQQIAETSLADIRQNPELLRYAVAGGESLYKVNCSQCHGSGAQGGAGYPNLSDDEWIWGGDLDSIHKTIAHGIRYEEDRDTRFSLMTAFGELGVLNKAQIADTAEHVLALSGQDHDGEKAARGAELFQKQCSSCHGAEGLGNRAQGAPNLADRIWLYASDRDSIIAQINAPKHGVMPAWQHRLSEESIKKLAVYVHTLGGGE